MRQITGAFLYYANAAKSIEGSRSAFVLCRLKISDPSMDQYLQTTCMEQTVMSPSWPRTLLLLAITQVSSRCSHPHLWSFHTNVHYFFNIHCNAFFPSNCGLPSVFSLHSLPRIQFVFLNSCCVSCRSLSFDQFTLRRNKYVGQLVPILSPIYPENIPTQQVFSRHILLWDFHECKIFHLASRFKVSRPK